MPPIPGKMPRVISGTAKTAVSLATMKSERIASSRPPPMANPSTAAITGTGQWRRRKAICSNISCWANHVSSVIPCRSLRSAPTEKALCPAPVRTTARTVLSQKSASKQARRSSHMAVFMAFRTSGRLSSTVTPKPSALRVTLMCL